MGESTKQLDVSVNGTEPRLELVDPNNRTYVGDVQGGKSVISIEDPEAGEWTVNSEDTSDFTTDVEVTDEILMDFGFSVQKPGSLKETLKSPIKGMALCYNFYKFLINWIYFSGSENILSIFLLNPEYVSEITHFKVGQNETTIEDIPLIKNDESSYSSDPFNASVYEQFKIFVQGWDSNNNPIFQEFTIVDAKPKPKPKPKDVEKIEIPKGVSQVIFTAKAKESSLKVYESSEKEYVGRSLGNDTEIVVIDDPSAGTWTVHSEDGFSYSFRKGTSVVTYGYGFSLEIPKSKEETSKKPIKGQSKNRLTMSY